MGGLANPDLAARLNIDCPKDVNRHPLYVKAVLLAGVCNFLLT
jgi:hypothetical protein